MRLALVLCIVAALATTWLLIETPPPAAADTIQLANGSVIHGKLVDDADREGHVRILFSNGGSLSFPKDAIAKVDSNDLDAFVRAESPVGVVTVGDRPLVRVVTKDADGYYGAGSYVGREAIGSDEDTLVLELRGGGELRIPRSSVASTNPVDEREAAVRPAAESRTIRTTHRVVLKNGRVIQGDLVTTDESAPLEIRVGDLGILRFPRGEVASVERAAGTLELPAPVAAETVAPEDLPPPADIEQLRREIRREVLHEILDQLLSSNVEAVLGRSLTDEEIATMDVGQQLPPETILEIQFLVRELGRQRTQNRVRAEHKLILLGGDVVPFLGPAASHPFELTRRATQRIIGTVGDERGIPLAIEALDDADSDVRALAHSALETLLPADIAYDASAPRGLRSAAQSAYRTLWLDRRRETVQATLVSRLRGMLDD